MELYSHARYFYCPRISRPLSTFCRASYPLIFLMTKLTEPKSELSDILNSLRNVIITLTNTLVATNLRILSFSLLHQCLKLGIV